MSRVNYDPNRVGNGPLIRGGLNAKQERFVREFMIDRNASAAFVRAGYTGKNVEAQSAKLMTNPMILDEIRRRTEVLAPKIEAYIERSAKDVADLLAKQAFMDPASFVEWGEDGRVTAMRSSADLTDDQRAALAQVEIVQSPDGSLYVKPKLVDRAAAARDLGKHLGMFVDRSENVNITANLANMTADQIQARIADRLNRIRMIESGDDAAA